MQGQLPLGASGVDRIREAIEAPVDEQPTTRLAAHGATCLSTSELLAIIGDCELRDARALVAFGLGAFVKNVSSGAYQGSLPKKQWGRLAAALELHRRIAALEVADGEVVTEAEMIGRRLVATYGHYPQERLVCTFLDGRNRVLHEQIIFVGTINSASVAVREPMKLALELNAVGIILSHNHPSGDPNPSPDDIAFTRKVKDAGKLMGVELLDHIVVGTNRFCSMKTKGYL